ncbi:hypothetical protein MMC17_001562 [Xylographa soralifera]|nr:hypothetical protein [Xylographa soralifera]
MPRTQVGRGQVMLFFLTDILLEDDNLKNTLELYKGKLSENRSKLLTLAMESYAKDLLLCDKNRCNNGYAAFLFRERLQVIESLVRSAWQSEQPKWAPHEKAMYAKDPTYWSTTLDHQLQHLPAGLKARLDGLKAKPETLKPKANDLQTTADDLKAGPDDPSKDNKSEAQDSSTTPQSETYGSLRKYLRHEAIYPRLLSGLSKKANRSQNR